MSDAVLPPGAASDEATAGTLLRRAREAAGVHMATLAASLKVPVRKLEALEEDRYDQLADTVFARALASSVCRTLKVDPRPVLDRLPQGNKPRLVSADAGINTPFRAPGDGPAPGWADQLTRPVGLAVVALLLGALVIVLLPTVTGDEAPAARPQSSAATAEPAAVALAPPAGDPAVAAAPGAAAAVMPLPLREAQPAATPVAAVASAPAALVDDAAHSPGIVVVRARGRSWVQVTDAHGASVFRKLLEAGETASATGTLPLSVTIGSVQFTEVQVRGKPFDLVPVTRDNVARFEVK